VGGGGRGWWVEVYDRKRERGRGHDSFRAGTKLQYLQPCLGLWVIGPLTYCRATDLGHDFGFSIYTHYDFHILSVCSARLKSSAQLQLVSAKYCMYLAPCCL
jgi:hypothetical protein